MLTRNNIIDISTTHVTRMIEITCNDRLGKKVRVKCNADDTVGDLKKLIAAQTGTKWERIVLKKWYTIFKVTRTTVIAEHVTEVTLL